MELATILTSLLSPFLPSLLKLGNPMAEEAGKTLGAGLGKGTWGIAKQAWSLVSNKVHEKPIAKGAAIAIAEDPYDDEAQAVLSQQLNKLLMENPALSQSLQKLLNEAEDVTGSVTNVTQSVIGNKNIVIGNGHDSIHITQG